MRYPKLISFIAALGFGASSFCFAQTTSPLPGPFPVDPTPRPFDYPEGLSSPQFTLTKSPAEIIRLGDFAILLGDTPLSALTRTLGGELHHLPDRTDFLCYSAPLPPSKPTARKSRKTLTTESENEDRPYIGQNIWFVIGNKGEVSEAKAEMVREGDGLCAALPEKFQDVYFGPFQLGSALKPKEIKKLEIPDPSLNPEDSKWKFWFAADPSSNPVQYGFFAVEENSEAVPTKMISVKLNVNEASH